MDKSIAEVTLFYDEIENEVDERFAYDLVEPAHNMFLTNFLEEAEKAKAAFQWKPPQPDVEDIKKQLRSILT